MPSQADVEAALVILAAKALYPNGIRAAPAIPSEARIFRGWPSPAALEADLATGIVNVSVIALSNATADTTRYLSGWQPAPVIPTLKASYTATTATFAGVADPGQLAGVLVDRQSFVHRTVMGDTPELVAAILSDAIAKQRLATVDESTISIPTARQLIARSAADASASLELRRQRQGFRITAWCSDPDLRDSVCEVLDVEMAATPFLTLADGSAARLRFTSSTSLDEREDAMLYRQDVFCTVEFATTQLASQPSMLFGIQGLGATTIIA